MQAKQFKLYHVTYTNRSMRLIRASSMSMAGSQATACDGSDIASVECMGTDTVTGKQARSIVRSVHPDISTRHMLATPARVLLRHSLFPASQARIALVANDKVVLRMGGAY